MFSKIYQIYISIFNFLSISGFYSLILLLLLSAFRITQLLKFLIPIKVFFELNDSGTLTKSSIVLLAVLVVAILLEASYQFLNQSLRYKIALKYLSVSRTEAKVTVLNFAKASSELTVSTLAVLTSIFVIGYFSFSTVMTFLMVFLTTLYALLSKYKIHKHEHKFEKFSDVREIMISSYAVLSMTITTLAYFYDWWHVTNLNNFILGFLLLRFMVNTSVSSLREYLTVVNQMKHESLSGIKL
ncbi:MAG: hypothetical protein AAF442_06440 [Pseudomonadota bacterium]